MLGHAENRSDAYAAGEQQAAPSLTHQREEVTRFTDEQPIATVDLLMHALRTTARVSVLEHTDQIAMALLRVIAQ
ncbi:hypothetical protein D3C81_2138710 [compost metagenome]